MTVNIPSHGSFRSITSNAINAAGQAIASNSLIDAFTFFLAGVLGGQNWQCGSVLHVGTSPGNGARNSIMTACGLYGNAGSTPPSQLCLTCNFPDS